MNYEAHSNTSITLMKLDRFEEAKQSINSAIQINPEKYQAHFTLAMVLEKLQKDELALKSYQKVIEIDSSNVASFTNMAAIYMR